MVSTAEEPQGRGAGEPTHKICVAIRAAKHLPKTDLMGKCDPYVILSGGDAKFKTSVVKKTYDAEYSEQFELLVVEGHGVLTLTVMDWDKLSQDDTIGTATVELTPELLLQASPSLSRVLPVQDRGKAVKGHDGEPTEVHITMRAEAL